MKAKIPDNVDAYLRDLGPVEAAAHEALAAAGLSGTYARYLSSAGPGELATFFDDLQRVDLDWTRRHRLELLGGGPGPGTADLEPVKPGTLDRDADRLRAAGNESLARGEWSAVVFTGGAATRFFAQAGVDTPASPKGLFPVTPVKGRSFLDLFAAQGLAAGIASGRMPYLVLMTSRLTEDALSRWAGEAPLQGHPRDFIRLMPQAEHPRLDHDGNLIVRPNGHLMFTGDGHGGVFKALLRPGKGGGTLAGEMAESGVRHLVLHNVDNAAANSFDAARLGYHVGGGYGLTLCVVPRQRPDEKVGLVAGNRATGGVECVEYSVCPRSLAEAAGPDGRPVFSLAHICTNLVDLRAIRADLTPTLYTGKRINVGPETIDSSTWEMLNQDLSRLLGPREVGVLLLDREDFFLPTKQLKGPDSLETTKRALADKGATLLRSAGARVHESALVEVDPCVGASPDDLVRAGIGTDWDIGPNARVYLGVRHGADGTQPFSPGLRVGAGATLDVSAELPYGRVEPDRATRAVREDPDSAGRVTIGENVTVAPGAAVEIQVHGNDSHVVDRDTTIS